MVGWLWAVVCIMQYLCSMQCLASSVLNAVCLYYLAAKLGLVQLLAQVVAGDWLLCQGLCAVHFSILIVSKKRTEKLKQKRHKWVRPQYL